MGFDIASVGEQAANNAVGAIFGLALEKHNDKRQLRQQQALTDMQLAANARLSDYNYGKEYDLWQKTSYVGQKEQLEKAGLNPALLYGGGGGGGATTGSPSGGISGGHAPEGGGEIMGLMMQNAQLQLMKAQTEATKAQANKTNAETGNVAAQGDVLHAQAASLTQGIQNQKAAQQLTEVQTQIANIDKNFANDSYEDRLSQITINLNRGIAILKSEQATGQVDAATVPQKIQILQNEAIASTLQNTLTEVDTELKRAQTDKTKADEAKAYQEIKTMITGLQQEQQKINISQQATNQANEQINVNSFQATTERMKQAIEAQYKNWLTTHPNASSTIGGMLSDMKKKFDKITGVKY